MKLYRPVFHHFASCGGRHVSFLWLGALVFSVPTGCRVMGHSGLSGTLVAAAIVSGIAMVLLASLRHPVEAAS